MRERDTLTDLLDANAVEHGVPSAAGFQNDKDLRHELMHYVKVIGFQLLVTIDRSVSEEQLSFHELTKRPAETCI